MSKQKREKLSNPMDAVKPHRTFTTPALYCFFIAARLGSIRGAAEQLHISPSAVSRHIAKLEAAIGTVLFDRLPRGLSLSSAGEVLYYHARESAKQIDRARGLISDMKGLKRGSVAVATTESVATGLLPPLITDFWKKYPEITVSLHATRSAVAFDGVVDGDFDLAIGFDMPSSVSLRVLASAKLVIGAWLPKDHPLANAVTVKLNNLIESRFLLPDETIGLRNLLNPQIRRLGAVEPRLVSNSTSVLERFTGLGSGVSIFTKIGTEKTQASSSTVFRPIRDLSRFSQTLQLCSRASGLSPSGTALANFLSGPIRALSDF
jgi:DNA-binding transcriptional LysR family regulator